MEKIKNLSFKLLFGNLILIIGIIIFVELFSNFFGVENSLLGVGVVTAILMCAVIDIDLPIKDSAIAIIVSLIIMGFSAYLSRLSPLASIFIDFITVFFIIYIFTNRMDTKTFLPFILCYVFLAGNPATIEKLPLRIVATVVGGILIALAYYITHKKKQEFAYNSLFEQLTSIQKSSLQFNFALRMAVGIAVAMLVGNYFSFQKSMWISITVMSLTQPHLHQTKQRIKYRVFGTILGSLIFVALFNFLVPKNLSTYVLLFLSYIYTFIKEYKVQIVFITMNSLGAAMILYDMSVSVPMRISFILAGTVIAFIVNKGFYDKFAKKEEEEEEEVALEA
ncbi:FUSC family protein [Lutibacter sp. B2]|nr:FUSC family protein [Lutibacter sp. B2]